MIRDNIKNLETGKWETIDREPTAEEQAQMDIDAARPPSAAQLKMIGVEFGGVMCSATKFDQWGLSSIEARVAAGATYNFEFENGAMLAIGPDNLAAFVAVWVPFRESFF